MSAIDSDFKVPALMAEYATLRSEIIARSGHGYPLVGLCFAAIAILFTSKELAAWTVWWVVAAAGYVAFVVVASAILMRKSWCDIKRCAARVREIELTINCLAHEDVMIWENLSGEAETGFFEGDSLPRCALINRHPPRPTFEGKLL